MKMKKFRLVVCVEIRGFVYISDKVTSKTCIKESGE